jgi:hypothetical protein
MVRTPYFLSHLRGLTGLVALGSFFCLGLGFCSPGHSQSAVPAGAEKSPLPNNLALQAREDLVRQLEQVQKDRTVLEQVRQLLEFLSEKPTSQVSRSLATMGDAKKPGTAEWLLPHRSKILTGTPTFYWQEVAGSSGYRVKLFQMVGGQKRLLWEATASQSPLSFPQDHSPLEFDKHYAWQVWVAGSGEGGPAATAAFVLPSEKDISAVQAEADSLEGKLTTSLSEAQTLVVLSGFYSQKGFYFKALQLLEQACHTSPDDTLVKAALTRVKEAMHLSATDQ